MSKNKTIILFMLLIFTVLISFILFKANIFSLGAFEKSNDQDHDAQTHAASQESKTLLPASQNSAAGQTAEPTSNNIKKEYATPLVNKHKIENTFASATDLQSGAIEQAITGVNFEKILDKMYSESIDDADALALTNEYGKNIKQSLQDPKAGISLHKVACGLSVCAAIISGDKSGSRNFESWLTASESNKKIPMYSVVSYSLRNSDGSYSHRIVFSNDPQTNGMASPAGSAHP